MLRHVKAPLVRVLGTQGAEGYVSYGSLEVQDSPKEQIRFSKMEEGKDCKMAESILPALCLWDGEGPSRARAQGSCGHWGSSQARAEVWARPGGGGPCVGPRRLSSGSMGSQQCHRRIGKATARWTASQGDQRRLWSGRVCTCRCWPWGTVRLCEQSGMCSGGLALAGPETPPARAAIPRNKSSWHAVRDSRGLVQAGLARPHLLNISRGKERLDDALMCAGDFRISVYDAAP